MASSAVSSVMSPMTESVLAASFGSTRSNSQQPQSESESSQRYELPVMSSEISVSNANTSNQAILTSAAQNVPARPAPVHADSVFDINAVEEQLLVVEVSSLDRAVELMCKRRLRPPIPIELPGSMYTMRSTVYLTIILCSTVYLYWEGTDEYLCTIFCL